MSRNLKWITLTGAAVLIGVLLIALTAGSVLAHRSGPLGLRSGSDWGYGPGRMMGGTDNGGMMSSWSYGPARTTYSAQEASRWSQQDDFEWGDCGSGGMMAGMGSGMMDSVGPGMMGGWGYGYRSEGTRLSPDQAAEAVESYLVAYGNSDLIVAELMEFTGNFYAQVEEQSTGIHAFELLINPYTGAVYPEPGPNMMWNTKYGHMTDGHLGGWGGMMGGNVFPTPSGDMSVSPEEAVQAAQAYLDRVQPGLTADDYTDEFYGYYTLHVLEYGEVVGMLSVNGTTGQVWYHTWHGDYIGMTEGHE